MAVVANALVRRDRLCPLRWSAIGVLCAAYAIDATSHAQMTSTPRRASRARRSSTSSRSTTTRCVSESEPFSRGTVPTVARTGHRVVASVHPGLQDGHRLRARTAGLHGRQRRGRAREVHHLLPQRKGGRHHVLGRQRGRVARRTARRRARTRSRSRTTPRRSDGLFSLSSVQTRRFPPPLLSPTFPSLL